MKLIETTAEHYVFEDDNGGKHSVGRGVGTAKDALNILNAPPVDDYKVLRAMRYAELGCTDDATFEAMRQFIFDNDRSMIDSLTAIRQQVKTEIPKP